MKPIDLVLEEAAHMTRATVAQIDLVNAMNDELHARRSARGDVLVIDWSSGTALSIDEGNVIAFPQPKRRRK